MKLSIVLILVVFAIASSAAANLGDNSDRIEDAYGTIAQRRLRDDGTVSVVYVKSRYMYLVTFANNRSISESYSHVNGTNLSEKEHVVQSAQQKLTAEKIASVFNVEEKKLLHQKIDIYLRDIEKCLSLLNA